MSSRPNDEIQYWEGTSFGDLWTHVVFRWCYSMPNAFQWCVLINASRTCWISVLVEFWCYVLVHLLCLDSVRHLVMCWEINAGADQRSSRTHAILLMYHDACRVCWIATEMRRSTYWVVQRFLCKEVSKLILGKYQYWCRLAQMPLHLSQAQSFAILDSCDW